jgi:flagellum-specific peptidoglycan hydrolase FlgJ
MLCLQTPEGGEMTPDQIAFLATASEAARASMKTGVPPSVTVAQAILESGWGKTGLAREFNNFFGIKANQFQFAARDYCEFPTHEVENHMMKVVLGRFARYATPADSFAAHAALLCRDHYKPAMNCLPNVDKFCWALGPKIPGHPEGCGYSTFPEYHDRLMQLIRLYNLTQYDQE